MFRADPRKMTVFKTMEDIGSIQLLWYYDCGGGAVASGKLAHYYFFPPN